VQLDDELRGAFILAPTPWSGRPPHPAEGEPGRRSAQCLRLLSGRNHRVYTAITLVTPKEAFRQRLVETRVRFKRLNEEDIQGLYRLRRMARQGRRLRRAGIADPSWSSWSLLHNVVGLPLYESVTLLGGEGFPIRFGWLNAT